MSIIEAHHLVKSWGDSKALNDVSLRIESGRLLALLGPSGSGKTTLLRIIGGLETTTSGRLLIDGHDAAHLPSSERAMGFVFQSYALFRHLSIFENVAFGLRVKPRNARPPETVIRARVHELLERMGLAGLAARRPHELSGGQKQRVALARALAVGPRILLLDEPFGALDTKVRSDLKLWLRELHHELKLTTILVTHDQNEAMELADDVVVLNHGRVEHQGSPRSLIDAPSSRFAREFIGDTQVFDGVVEHGVFRLGKLRVDALPHETGTHARLLLRPHELDVRPIVAGDAVQANGTITHVAFLADRAKVTVVLDEGPQVVISTTRGCANVESFARDHRVVVNVNRAFLEAS